MRACKDEALLIWWDPLLVLNLRFHVIDSVGSFNVEGDRLAGESLHKDLHTSAQTKHQVERRFFLNIIIRECTTVFQLLACKDEALLVRRDA